MVRETDLEQRERKDKETDEYRRARQARLGHVSVPEEEVVEEEKVEEPKPKARAKPKAPARAKPKK